jgi:hypothetical protein
VVALLSKIRLFLLRPVTWQIYHGFWAVVWALLFVPAMTVWKESIPFLMFVSMQTALGGALGGFAAALGARKADPEDSL